MNGSKYLLLLQLCIMPVRAADCPKIVPYSSARDAHAVQKMFNNNYEDIISSADSITEQQRYITELLNRYKECEDKAIDNRYGFQKQFVMVHNQETIGFMSIIFNKPFTPFGVPTGSIKALAIDHHYRGNSYGADLCNYGCDILKEHGAHKVGVMTTSQDVYKKFYSKLGFKPSMIGSAGKFDPTFFYNKRLVPPQSWATWALYVLRRLKK